MYTNADMTLYSYDKASKGYVRKAIMGVFWADSKQANTLKSGIETADAVKVLIPRSSIRGKLAFTTGKDLVVKGVCSLIFDNTEEKTISQSLKKLKETARVLTVSSADEKLYGSESMQHYKLGCK